MSLSSKITHRLGYIWKLASGTPYSKAILVLQSLSGIFSFTGLPMLIPVLNYLNDTKTEQPSKYLGVFNQALSALGIEPNFYSILVIAVVLILLGQVLITVCALLAVYSLADVAKEYRKKIFDAYSKVSWPWLVDSRSGDLHFAVIKTVDMAAQAHLDAQRVVISLIQILIFLGIAIKLSWVATLTAAGVYGFLGMINVLNSKYIRRLGERHAQCFGRLSNEMATLQQNKKFLKTSLLNNELLKPVFQLIDQLAGTIKNENFYVQLQNAWNLIVTFLFLIVLMVFHKQFALGYSELLVILVIFSRMAPNFSMLTTSYASLAGNIPLYESLQRRLDDLHRHREENGTQSFVAHSPIRFEKTVFSYPDGTAIFKGLNLTIEPRQTTAFIGSSGVGKSTLLDLILGLLKPTNGAIYYGDTRHDAIDKNSLRRMIAYVSQETTLVDGTLRENLAIRAKDISEERVNEILRKVGLDDIVAQMPKGLDTPVGENGVKLSGGQRQRVALGRALFSDPKILILDEATSSLDSLSESQIQETIRNFKNEFTIIIVSHKLSTVRLADAIFVLEGGGVCESGSYQQLLEKKGKLHAFDSLQQ